VKAVLLYECYFSFKFVTLTVSTERLLEKKKLLPQLLIKSVFGRVRNVSHPLSTAVIFSFKPLARLFLLPGLYGRTWNFWLQIMNSAKIRNSWK